MKQDLALEEAEPSLAESIAEDMPQGRIRRAPAGVCPRPEPVINFIGNH